MDQNDSSVFLRRRDDGLWEVGVEVRERIVLMVGPNSAAHAEYERLAGMGASALGSALADALVG